MLYVNNTCVCLLVYVYVCVVKREWHKVNAIYCIYMKAICDRSTNQQVTLFLYIAVHNANLH